MPMQYLPMPMQYCIQQINVICIHSYFRRVAVEAVGDVHVVEATNDRATAAVPPS